MVGSLDCTVEVLSRPHVAFNKDSALLHNRVSLLHHRAVARGAEFFAVKAARDCNGDFPI